MADADMKHLMIEVGRSPVLRRLREMAAETLGVSLVILVRSGRQMRELDLGGEASHLSDFCRVLRSKPEGLKRCMTCRSLVSMGASYRGLSRYTCHGGVSVVAAPAVREGESDLLIVASCAFADKDGPSGWRQIRAHVADVPIDFAALRSAYERLPRVDAPQYALVKAIVDLAASAIRDIRRLLVAQDRVRDRGGGAPRDDGPTLDLLSNAEGRATDEAGAPALVDLVKAMVERDPSMPFTVAKVAKAARMTPNHFSTLFHREAGEKFVDFLTDRRIELAQRLLRDPTLSVKEIAQRSGFADAAYFARRFRKAVGVSPSRWRGR